MVVRLEVEMEGEGDDLPLRTGGKMSLEVEAYEEILKEDREARLEEMKSLVRHRKASVKEIERIDARIKELEDGAEPDRRYTQIIKYQQ